MIQLICHVALVASFFVFSLTDWLIVLFVYFLTACLGATITLHRYYSHRGFEFKNKFLEKFFILCSVWGAVGDPISWVNTHRNHHRLTDRVGDPHSPKILGFFRVQWLSMFNTPTSLRMVPDLIRDNFLVFIHKYYFHFHWFVLVSLLLINWKLAMIIYLVPAAIVWNMGSFINNFGHTVGYRSYESDDTSRNNLVLGYAVWGEGWHNNHHNAPKNVKFGEKWWEFDMGYEIIKLVGYSKQ